MSKVKVMTDFTFKVCIRMLSPLYHLTSGYTALSRLPSEARKSVSAQQIYENTTVYHKVYVEVFFSNTF